MEDLYQIGCMGFIKAIKRFDTSFEVKLSTYSVPYILGEIKRFIRDDGIIKVSRSIKELGLKINELKKEYLIKKGRKISKNEIAKELEVSKEEIIMAQESYNCVDSIEQTNNNSKNKSDKKLNLLDKISNEKNEEELVINKITIQNLIENLPSNERKIILLRFYKEKTQTEIAKILGVSQVQISRIEKKVLGKLKEKLVC